MIHRRSRTAIASLALVVAFTLLVVGPWRVQVVALKAAGRISGITWRETFRYLRPGSGVWLRPLVKVHSADAVITAPSATASDFEAGRAAFARRCTVCHGINGDGGSGPSLRRSELDHGSSEWAMFRTISQGIPGTAMPAQLLTPDSIWRLVVYLRRLRLDPVLARDSDLDRSRETLQGIGAVTYDRLRTARQDSTAWLTYSGTYDGQRHSRLSQVNRANVSRLRPAWIFQIPQSVGWAEVTPLVVDGVMFLTAQPAEVFALDARTGARLWTYSWAVDEARVAGGYGQLYARGLAVHDSTLYMGTIDAHLLALDARTGRLRWAVPVADSQGGYFTSSPPLALQDRVIVGTAGGESATRGFLDAYDAATGRRLWRFHTVPGPGEPGHDTWSGDSWQHGGAPTWLTGSYDPDLDLVYWGVGNPMPGLNGDGRLGDNLYSNSVIAVEPSTGRLRWYFQFTPHDEHDWDAAQIPVLADAVLAGRSRRLLYWANRNGFYYVLDRETGQFLSGRPFAIQTWASGLDPGGRPVELPGARPTPQGARVAPANLGATNWWSPSYDARLQLFFVPTFEGTSMYFKGDGARLRDANDFMGSRYEGAPGASAQMFVRALDASTGVRRWEYLVSQGTHSSIMGGLLSTDGGLVFGGGPTGNLFALDSRTGRELWRYNAGATAVTAAPITYMIAGTQYVTVAAGRALLTFSIARE